MTACSGEGAKRAEWAAHRRETVRRLEREGVACLRPEEAGRGDGQAGAWRRFAVSVEDVKAVRMFRIYLPETGKPRRLPAEPDDRLRRIVERAAVRAAYVLGWGSGTVVVATDAGGRPFVECGSRGPDGQASAQPVEESPPVLLGADPEFVLTDRTGHVVPASRYLPPGGEAGSDSVVRKGIRLWPIAELRPRPASEPAAVVAELRRLLTEAARRAGRSPLVWRAGALPVRGFPLGGHIHVSGAALTGERLRALDNAVALPLRLLEPPGAAARRPRYGALGDFRRQPHGGFEYRTPPSWLVSPGLALGVLALAKFAVQNARRLAGFRPLDDDRLREAFYGQGNEAIETLKEAAMRFYGELRRIPGYARCAGEIDFVFDAVFEGRHWDESADFRSAWGIPVP